MIDSKNLKTYVRLLDHKFRVKYNRAQAKRLEQKLSSVDDPDDVNELFNNEFYSREFVNKQPIRHNYMYRF